MHIDDTDLGERLGVLADTAVRGPAPVDEMVRGGRRRRARRRVAVGTAAVLAVAASPLAAASLPSPSSEPATVPTAASTAATAGESAASSARDLTEVEPYEQVTVNDEVVIALLPGGERYAVAPPDAIDEEIERSEDAPDAALPEDGELLFDPNPDRPYGELLPFTGLVGTEGVARMTIEPEGGETRDVELLTLPGDPGWAVFYAETETGESPVRVSTYDSDGDVILSFHLYFDDRETF
jgi:hypothetical protein